MAGPHPLVSQARHALARSFSSLPVGSTVLLAVSGGADSMSLAASAVFSARDRAIQVHSLTVDHSIRPESGEEARRVAENLRKLGCCAHTEKISLPSRADSAAGPEGEARNYRYLALARWARKLGTPRSPATVFLGHNANDQAETVLLGLGRGSGARSIAGMRERGPLPVCEDVPMCRPLLDFSAADLRTVCECLHLEFFDDPTNELESEWKTAAGKPLRRASVRHRVIPLLEEILDAGVVAALGRTAKMLRDDDDALSLIAAEAYADVALPAADAQVLDCAKLAKYPRAVRTRVIRSAILACGGRGGELVYWHLSELDRLVTDHVNKRGIDLPGVKARRENNLLELRRNSGETDGTERYR